MQFSKSPTWARSHLLLLCAGLGLLTVGTLSTEAQARSTRVGQIPNAPNSCGTCHVGTEYTMRNAFGQDVEANLVGTPIESADVAWMVICDLDSDADGESNGVELGDPCCAWTDGDAPLDVTSFPDDDTSTSGNSCDNGTAVGGSGGDGDGDGGTPGGCPFLGGSAVGLASIGLGVLGFWRRRRLL